ncbi:heparan sulfate glucosamine 3-O-sulfotransferase 5-like [Colossoma macropomum]|uniref:heparan sulfate glucosamine 3-O-sulfotransferase 5-like n=1 Tax=Colossoma macropomum TaxID=42526 RepID=UPI001864A221|nr:heparan sulfate glucosamine 3-O-sulfotransferase 5-like [Colossoma macropomum]
MLFPQLAVLLSLVLGTLLYLLTHTVHLDRLQPMCPVESRPPPAGVLVQFPFRPLQYKRGLLHKLRRSNATRGRLIQQLPHAIIIGVRKGGTRALLEMLNLHPAVVKASQEVHFFDSDHNYGRGMAWYRHRMPFSLPGQITIEKSPAYFVTEKVPERIFRMNSSVKLLVIVREPTTRAISDYTQVLEGKEHKNKTYHSFETLAIDSSTREVNTKYKAVRTSIYAKHLEHWLEFFPVQQFHVVDGDRLITDPLPELRLAERFLNLPPGISQDNLYFNSTRGFYCLRFSRRFSKCLAGSKGRTHPNVDPAVLDKLRHFYHPFNQKFYQITGRKFDWP